MCCVMLSFSIVYKQYPLLDLQSLAYFVFNNCICSEEYLNVTLLDNRNHAVNYLIINGSKTRQLSGVPNGAAPQIIRSSG